MKPHTFHRSGTASLPTINLAQVRPEKVRSSTEPNQSLVPEPYQSIPAQDLLKDNCGFSGWIRKEGSSFKTCKLIQTYIIRISLSVQRKSAIGPHAGSRGDVFFLEHQNPSKTLEKWVILIALQVCYTFYIPQTKRQGRSVALWATCCVQARLWLAVIDFQNGKQQSRSG